MIDIPAGHCSLVTFKGVFHNVGIIKQDTDGIGIDSPNECRTELRCLQLQYRRYLGDVAAFPSVTRLELDFDVDWRAVVALMSALPLLAEISMPGWCDKDGDDYKSKANEIDRWVEEHRRLDHVTLTAGFVAMGRMQSASRLARAVHSVVPHCERAGELCGQLDSAATWTFRPLAGYHNDEVLIRLSSLRFGIEDAEFVVARLDPCVTSLLVSCEEDDDALPDFPRLLLALARRMHRVKLCCFAVADHDFIRRCAEAARSKCDILDVTRLGLLVEDDKRDVLCEAVRKGAVENPGWPRLVGPATAAEWTFCRSDSIKNTTPTVRVIMKARALLFGLNYPNSPSALNGCVNDVQNMAAFLRGVMPPSQVSVFTDTDEATRKSTTAMGMVGRLYDLAAQTYREDLDLVWIHYSGHGSSIVDRSGDELDGRDECLVPTDYAKAGLIPDDIIDRLLRVINPKTRVVFVCDACHSGTMCDVKYSWTSPTKVAVENILCSVAAKVISLSGCMDDETSADAFGVLGDGKYSGALTGCLLRVLSEVPAARGNVFQVLQLLSDKLIGMGFQQRPKLCSTYNLAKDTVFF